LRPKSLPTLFLVKKKKMILCQAARRLFEAHLKRSKLNHTSIF
jgi:hypothetical protein